MAETVTISTFLELRDNMSAGLKKVEAALGAVSKANQTSQRAQASSAERAQKQQERAARAEEQRIRRLAKMQIDAAALDARLRAKALQGARNDAVARMREMDRLAKHAKRVEEQIAKSRFGPKYDPAARSAQQRRMAEQAARAMFGPQFNPAARSAQQRRMEEQIAKSRLGPIFDPAARAKESVRQAQAAAKAREAAERRVARAAEMESRRASRSVASGANASVTAAERAARARIAAERRVAREAERAAQDRKRFIGQAGAAMFGPSVGGIIAAYSAGGMEAAGPLAALAGLEAALGAVKKAAVVAYDAVKGFIIKTFEVGQRYQNDVRNIALTLRGLDVTPTFNLGKQSAQNLYETMRVLAAKLPGETQDYMSVFGFGLPTALDAGLKKSQASMTDYAKFVSKFTAYGFVRGVTDPFHLGRDLERLQQGKVIGQTRMFKELKPFMDAAIRDTKTFNHLASDVRMAHVFKAVEKATRGIDETLYDADALLGTMNSEITRIYQKGGQPLFESSLRIINKINEYLIKNNNEITTMVSLVSSKLGIALEGSASLILDMVNDFSKLTQIIVQLDSVLKNISSTYGVLRAAADYTSFEVMERGIKSKAEQELKLQQDKKRRRDVNLAGPDVASAYRELESRLQRVTLPQFVVPSEGGMSSVAGTTRGVSGYATKQSLAGLRYEEGQRVTAGVIEKFALEQAKSHKFAGETFEAMFSQIGMSSGTITRIWQQAQNSVHGGFDTMPGEKAGRARKAPAGRQQTINDFRFSKFDIKQEFAEGFDPDRIAVAFASDLAKLGEMRMQSAYAPLFAIGSGS